MEEDIKLIFQIIYEEDETQPNEIHWLFKCEAAAMYNAGILVGLYPLQGSDYLLYRGRRNSAVDYYKNENRFINQAEHIVNYEYMSKYYPYISDLSIETFFVDDLNEETIVKIKERGWEKAFIKKDVKALEHIDEGKSVWPNTSFEEMKELYDEMNIKGKYAIRKFIEHDIIDQEERYWVLNGNIYHRDNIVPDVVKEAAKRLDKLGSKYYTIDATPEFVVEVNPGESSDRHAVNSAELFASWIKKEFDK